jgi:hypothetical protein
MDTIKSISDIQLAVKAELEKNTYFVVHGCDILIENAKDIEFQIKNAMGSCGIVATVATPSLTYRGDYSDGSEKSPYWEMNSMNVVIVENPTLNRGRANYTTALDAALQVAETLNCLPNICNSTITQSTNGGLVVVSVAFKTNVVFALERTED